ncbi:MAG: hypothetical protein F6K56_34220 [Moorea sp. SIO3G5]|nr:hypothetical protein [Moorena sp. SIO3G5]
MASVQKNIIGEAIKINFSNESIKYYDFYLFPVSCSLFPVPCSLFPTFRKCFPLNSPT